MRKIILIAILALLLGTIAVEAQKSGIYSKPTLTDEEGKPTAHDGRAKEKGRITDNYYVVVADNQKYKNEDVPKGTILINPEKDKIVPNNLREIPAIMAAALGKQKYQYSNGKFTYTKTTTKKEDNVFEEYKTTTETTITIADDGLTKKYDQVTKICGSGLTKCEGDWKTVPGSQITKTEKYTVATKKDKDTEEKRYVLSETNTAIYNKKNENVGTLTANYQPSRTDDPFSTRIAEEIKFTVGDITYYKAIWNVQTQDLEVEVNKIDEVEGLTTAEKNRLRDQIIREHSLSFTAAWKTYSTWQKVGRVIRAYYEYAGLRQLTSLFWPKYEKEVQERKNRIQQQFCLAAGITNCAVSTICGNIYKISADNVLAGRGPGGRFVSSASLNAERSQAIEVEGMTRQQMLDLFGNYTVIKGVLINLTNPAFDPRVLGKIKLRLYHVQYSVTNNAENEKDLNYNLIFRRVGEALNSSYGTPIAQARWWKNDQSIKYLETARDDIYKFSATEYNAVCLTFDPRLPSGHAAHSSMVGQLCVPFVEYTGPPTEIAAPGAAQPPAPAPGTTVADTPGALV
ncbi:MAG: hypothetical protein QW165_01990 [Candidatus Woesearchaeota archaeon]